MRWPAFLMVAILVAGCSAPVEPEPAAYVDVENPMPDGLGHDHGDPEMHRFARGAAVMGHHPLRDHMSPGDILGLTSVANLNKGDTIAATVNGDRPGVYILNGSNLDALEVDAFYGIDGKLGTGKNMAYGFGGAILFLAVQEDPEQPGGISPGIIALDVRNLSAIRVAGQWVDPLQQGPSAVAYNKQGDNHIVFARTHGIAFLEPVFDAEIGELTFRTLTHYVPLDEALAEDADATIESASGATQRAQWLADSLEGNELRPWQYYSNDRFYVTASFGPLGVRILDTSTLSGPDGPRAPVLAAYWQPPIGPNGEPYSIKLATLFHNDDGRAILLAISQGFDGANADHPARLWVFDATAQLRDVEDRELVPEGVWTNPGGVAAGHFQNSLQSLRYNRGHAILAHGHGGVWAVGVGDAKLRQDPQTTAYITPVPELDADVASSCCEDNLIGVPSITDLTVTPNRLIVGDYYQGLYSVKVDALHDLSPFT